MTGWTTLAGNDPHNTDERQEERLRQWHFPF
jgi:hypothetical protein